MAMDKSTDVDKALLSATGKLPADDKITFTKIVTKLQEVWGINRPPEIMLVNRMVSTWMKLKRVEEMLKDYDLFFENRDDKGNITSVTVNQLAYYLRSLESDFIRYYRTLQTNCGFKGDEGPKDFHDWLNEDEKKGNKK